MANGHEYRTYFEAAADFWQEVVLSELEDFYIGTVSGINISPVDRSFLATP